MTQFSLLELASQGDPEAIAILMNRQLQPRSVTVKVEREQSMLRVMFASDQYLNQQSFVTFVINGIRTLKCSSIRQLHLLTYQTGAATPVWSQQLDLNEDPQEDSQPVLLPQSKMTASEASSTDPGDLNASDTLLVDHFLVCGLGSLGQYCVLNLNRFALREFGVHVSAIDKAPPTDWEVDHFLDLLVEAPIIGDCRHDQILLKAGVKQCRAILFVTNSESDNIEAAIAARRLNPTAQLVVRSSKKSLNQLLKQQLGNFAAFEPTELPAPAFALAGLRAGILGFFNIGDCRLQVVEQQVQPQDYRFDNFPATLLHKRTYRLLSFTAAGAQLTEFFPRAFYQWRPETRVRAGDTIAYIEVVESRASTALSAATSKEKPWQWFQQRVQDLLRGNLRQQVTQFWQWVQAQQTRQVVGAGLLTGSLMWILGAVLLKFNVEDMSWQTAIAAGAILLLGGFGDVFGGLQNAPVPWWVQLACLLITAVSFLFVLGVLGLIADSLLSSRFDFLKKRLPIPKQNHVVLVGFGRVGQRVAALLQEFKQPVVAVTEQLDNPNLLTQIPLVIGNPVTELAKVNLSTAKSVIVVTDDQMLNLEVALMARDSARQVDRDVGLVIRTYDQRFGDNLTRLLPDAKVLGAYALSAEAFAGAAFGESILGLFRLNRQTILVTEYAIAAGDTLVEKLLAEVSYGYSVVPIFHSKGMQPLHGNLSEFLLPSEDRRLHAGDRLIVLASMNGLRRIERGDIAPPRRWQLEAQRPLNLTFLHHSGNDLARISGCNLDEARTFMNNLPGTIELFMYDYQAHRLRQELSKQLSIALLPL
jgi:Trk K+ transport system NAD-binding subunit